MKKIIVAGLGHGGIAAAALLAEKGYDVTVYEMKSEGTLGYDWTDIFDPKSLAVAGMSMPDNDKFEYKEDMSFYPPNEKKHLSQHVPIHKRDIKMERKDIYNHFINYALERGVRIVYDCKVNSPLMSGSRVIGISTDKGDFYADLVIDACGMNSPVRQNLPGYSLVEKEVGRKEKITIYRAFYNKGSDCDVDSKFKITVFAGGVQGISWVACEDDYTDVLIGRFEDFDVDEALRFTDFLRQTNPRIGTERLRGGQFAEIPVRRTLAVMVTDGYAAIGDSAFMPIPLIGSGIANALHAAKILADTVSADKNQAFTAETLWDYQVKYYKEVGAPLASLEAMKYFLLKLTPEEINFFFDNEIINEDDIAFAGDFNKLSDLLKLDPKAIAGKIKTACSNTVLLKKLFAAVGDVAKVGAICAAMPKKWDYKKVALWAKTYTKAFK